MYTYMYIWSDFWLEGIRAAPVRNHRLGRQFFQHIWESPDEMDVRNGILLRIVVSDVWG